MSEVGSFDSLRASKGAFSEFLDTYSKEENKSSAQKGKLFYISVANKHPIKLKCNFT